MLAPAGALLVLGFGIAFAPGVAGRAVHAGMQFEARSEYASQVLHGAHPSAPRAGALAVAAFGLYRRRLPAAVLAGAARVAYPPISRLKALHSGVVGDYVAWLTLGTAALGGLFALTLR